MINYKRIRQQTSVFTIRVSQRHLSNYIGYNQKLEPKYPERVEANTRYVKNLMS